MNKLFTSYSPASETLMVLYTNWDDIRLGNIENVPHTLRVHDHSDIDKRIFTFVSQPRAIARWYVQNISVTDLEMDIDRESGEYYGGFSQFDIGVFL